MDNFKNQWGKKLVNVKNHLSFHVFLKQIDCRIFSPTLLNNFCSYERNRGCKRRNCLIWFSYLNQLLFWKYPSEGQIKPKADWRAIDSHKKRTDKFVLFAFFTLQQTNQISPFVFWENLQLANLLFSFIWPFETKPVKV